MHMIWGIDTLSVFRRQVDWYRGKLLRTSFGRCRKEEQAARRLYLQGEQRLQANDWIKIAHISKYLSQNAKPSGGNEGAAANGFGL